MKRLEAEMTLGVRAVLMALVLLCAGACDGPRAPEAEDELPASSEALRIVGSSTLYPFAVAVAEEMKHKTGLDAVVEATGSGGGQKMFCAGAGPDAPDIATASRPQKPSEAQACLANQVGPVAEIKIGSDGIVLANGRSAAPMDVSLGELYLALAKSVPGAGDNCQMQANPFKLWSDISPALPATKIEVHGPPPTSGTRDAFVDIAMQAGALTLPCLLAMKQAAPEQFQRAAQTLREDGAWIDSGENDSAIIQTLTNTPSALGVFGYSFLHENRHTVQAAKINAIAPSFQTIASGEYPMSRALYVYIKEERVASNVALAAFVDELTSEGAWGTGGYLAGIGLVPLPAGERADYKRIAERLRAQ